VSEQSAAGPDQHRPVLRVVRGTPTAAELAALVTVVTAATGSAEPPPRPLSVWSARSRLVRPPLRPGPGAWRSSAWPR
jgi:hypothetical protein